MHGYKAWIVYGLSTKARATKSSNNVDPSKKAKGRKIMHGGSHRWLDRSHPYCRNLLFDGKVDHRVAPRRMSVDERKECGKQCHAYIANGGKKEEMMIQCITTE